MKYENYYTRANRGLIVFLIDQSASMSATCSNGLSLAEIAANIINLTLNDIFLGLMCTGDVKNSATIAAIGYGGKNSDNAEILFCESINKIDETFPKFSTIIATKEGNATIECIQAVKAVAKYGSPMASAFKLAKEAVAAWVNTHNEDRDPVPVVINVSGGYPTDSETDVRKYANEIMNMSVPDGNVLLYNTYIPRDFNCRIMYPGNGETMPDKKAQLLYDISSKASKDLIDECCMMRPNVQPDCRLFFSGIDRRLEESCYFFEKLLDDKIKIKY